MYSWFQGAFNWAPLLPRVYRTALGLVAVVFPVFTDTSIVVVVNKIKMARKPGKKQKENPVRYTGESKR